MRLFHEPRARAVRLIVTEAASGVCVRLEPETSAEMEALEAAVARGESTNGQGRAAIATLLSLAARLGYAARTVDHPVSLPPRSLVVVRRTEMEVYQRAMTFTRDGTTVMWDRRESQRRTTQRAFAEDRRRRGRRRRPPETWDMLGFLVVWRSEALR